MKERGFTIAVAFAVALVLARSAVFLLWEQAGFDSDQAIFGLMAQHIAEGRAFPLFIYGQRYFLAVEAWLAAPLFALSGPSVALLKTPVVLINATTAVLLVWILHRDGGLRPMLALVASLFFVFAPPGTAGALSEASGGNAEPFLYLLLLWMLRHRPLAFGLVFAFGFIHREFTIYGVTAIVSMALLADRRVNDERLKAVAIAGIAYLAVAQLARIAFVFSTPFGPGTAVAAAFGGGENIAALGGRLCFAPASIVPGLSGLFGHYLGIPFGAVDLRLADHGVRSTLQTIVPGVPPFWPLLGAILAAAFIRVVWLSMRHRQPIWRGPGAVGAFLLLVGLQAGVVYAVARCGRLEIGTFRYALLLVYLGVGVVALYFIYETRPVLRRGMVAAMLIWTAVTAASHVQLMREYVYREPRAPHRELANYLVSEGIGYARSDYWTAYATTFFAKEQAIVASTTLVRISQYEEQVAAHSREAVNVQREPCRSDGGIEAVPGTYWICPP